MDAFTYTLNIEIPESVKKGESVTVFVKAEEPSQKIKDIYATIPQYGIFRELKPANDGYYRLVETVPYVAPTGLYNVKFYAVNENNEKGPVKTIQIQIS